MRDIIYNELMKVYAHGDQKAEISTFAADVNDRLAFTLAEYLRYGETVGTDNNEAVVPPDFRGFVNKIWMVWPGRTAAEQAAKNILNAVGVELK